MPSSRLPYFGSPAFLFLDGELLLLPLPRVVEVSSLLAIAQSLQVSVTLTSPASKLQKENVALHKSSICSKTPPNSMVLLNEILRY